MNNININSIEKLQSPYDLKNQFPINYEDILFIQESRNEINKLIKINSDNNINRKILVICGPCSIHNYNSCIEYAEFIKKIQSQFKNLYIVMRMYFEKPRTIDGWKGFLYDPEINNTNKIDKGLVLTRKLLIEVTKMRIPIATEFLDTIIPQYIDDLVSWGCIGARTTESQLHRQLASGLSIPIGFKNGTNGNHDIAINACLSSKNPHIFLGVDINGQASIIRTSGNKNTCIVLRGSKEKGNNIKKEIIDDILSKNKNKNLNAGIIIDVSHDNTIINEIKDYNRQINNIETIIDILSENKNIINGIMIESNIKDGNQSIETELEYGKSITDKCINIEKTYSILERLNLFLEINNNNNNNNNK